MQNRADQNQKHKRVTFKLIKLYLKTQKQCINSLEIINLLNLMLFYDEGPKLLLIQESVCHI
jgi:hypothetical protein